LVHGLLNYPHRGANWVPEPHTAAEINISGKIIKIKGTFRHDQCRRVSTSGQAFDNLTCSICSGIPQEGEFRLRVLREDSAPEKRGSRDTGQGRRLEYLSVFELGKRLKVVNREFQAQSRLLWSHKARLAQLKMSRPTLQERARQLEGERGVLNFCHNIISAHRTGAFGRKPTLWDFMQDVARNLNRSAKGFRFLDNSKSFVRAMKMYGGRRMVDLYSLNMYGPSYDTIKRENKKGVHFVPGEHREIFRCVADIYHKAMVAHDVSGPVPVILSEE
jgi:hypothetical protein